MIRHLGVFLALLGSGYLAVMFTDIPGSYIVAVPAVFIVYLGCALILKRESSAGKKSEVVPKKRRNRT